MQIKRVKLFSNDNENSKEIEKILKNELEKENFIICDKDYELAIAIGGDGSFLRMLKRSNFNSDIYYIGVNSGTLGFLQEIKPKDLNKFVEKLKNNNIKIEEIGIQETIIHSKNSSSLFYTLNEIVIRDKNLNTTKLNIRIDDFLLEKFIGDGILVSTSTGSTAYNLSYGGSIVYNTLHTLQITPIAPLNNKSYRSLLNSVVLPENKLVTIIPENKNLLITVDGENKFFDDVNFIETSVKNKRIKCIRNIDYDFSTKINEKFLK